MSTTVRPEQTNCGVDATICKPGLYFLAVLNPSRRNADVVDLREKCLTRPAVTANDEHQSKRFVLWLAPGAPRPHEWLDDSGSGERWQCCLPGCT
ncbi:MAG: hypothetical protein ACYSYV_00085 [Planctomycetota bacterium]